MNRMLGRRLARLGVGLEVLLDLFDRGVIERDQMIDDFFSAATTHEFGRRNVAGLGIAIAIQFSTGMMFPREAAVPKPRCFAQD